MKMKKKSIRKIKKKLELNCQTHDIGHKIKITP